MYIRNAMPNEAERIMEIIDSAKSSLRALGIDQWQDGYPNLESTKEDIKSGISRVVVNEDEKIIATAAVYVGDEPTYHDIYDGKWLTDNRTYGIIHRIAVDPNSKNGGTASYIMSYCEELSQQAGATSMRCDTHFDNEIMQHTLEKNGYIRCGTIYLSDGDKRVAYEKQIFTNTH